MDVLKVQYCGLITLLMVFWPVFISFLHHMGCSVCISVITVAIILGKIVGHLKELKG